MHLSDFLVYIHASARTDIPHPTKACYAVIIRTSDGDTLYHYTKTTIEDVLANEAFYVALQDAFTKVLKHRPNSVRVFSSLELLIRQMNFEWRVKNRRLLARFKHVQQLQQQLGVPVTYVWENINPAASLLAESGPCTSIIPPPMRFAKHDHKGVR